MTSREQITSAFVAFRDELDDANDRRDRIIKACRDITTLSKRIIFLLLRLASEEQDSSDAGGGGRGTTPAQRAAAEARPKLREIQKLFGALHPELEGDRYWRHQRSVSGGLQEYIEALSLAHYLEHETLITFDETQRSLCDDDGVPFLPLTANDHLLGLSDLTGELMRFAINSIPHKGGRAKAAQVCAFVRACKADFEMFTPYLRRELRKKQAVTANSLQKIEDAVYTITVRTAEYDLPPEIIDDIVARCMSDFSSGGGRGRNSGRGRDDKFDEDEDED